MYYMTGEARQLFNVPMIPKEKTVPAPLQEQHGRKNTSVCGGKLWIKPL